MNTRCKLSRGRLGRLPVTSFALAGLCSLASGQISQAGGPYAKGDILPQPVVPNVILHEVVFDSLGLDGSAGNGEWVELYTSKAMDLNGYTLRDNGGAVLYTFGNLSMPAYGTVLVLFSDSVQFPWDTDPSDGQVAVAANLPHGDHLGNNFGGVRLVNGNGKIKDAVYWGTGSAPSGSPRGQWFDISLATGNPMGEGDSLGRPADPYSSYTGKIADWDRHGGKNALKATPGGRNGVDVYNFSGMMTDTQGGIVDILIGFSDQIQVGRIAVTDANISGMLYGSSLNSLTLDATHTFDITDNGAPGILWGDLTSTYTFDETPGNVSFSFAISGSLTSTTGFTLDIDYSMNTGGAHTNTPTRQSDTTVTWNENSQTYSYSIAANTSSERTGQNTWEYIDHRTSVDFGGAGPKNSDSVAVHTRLSDGVYQTVFDMDRDSPIQMPSLGASGTQVLTGIETTGSTHTQTTLSNGDFSGIVTRQDYSIDNVLYRTLDAGKTGTYSAGVDFANTTSTSVAREFDLTLPMLLFGSPLTITVAVDALDTIVGGKSISTASREVKLGSFVFASDTAAVDPPLTGPFPSIIRSLPQQDPQPAPAGDDKPKEDDGLWDAVTTCASRGAAVGGSGGAVVGGVIGAGAGAVVVPGLGAVPGWAAGGTAGAGIGAAGGTLIGSGVCAIGWLFDW